MALEGVGENWRKISVRAIVATVLADLARPLLSGPEPDLTRRHPAAPGPPTAPALPRVPPTLNQLQSYASLRTAAAGALAAGRRLGLSLGGRRPGHESPGLVSCHYVYVCVAITRQLRQKLLSMKCRYVHVSTCRCLYHLGMCMNVML